jgi:hypothetical protein
MIAILDDRTVLRFAGLDGVRGYTDEAVEVLRPTSTLSAGTATIESLGQRFENGVQCAPKLAAMHQLMDPLSPDNVGQAGPW